MQRGVVPLPRWRWFPRKYERVANSQGQQTDEPNLLPDLPPDLKESESILRQALGQSEDIHYRPIMLRWKNRAGLMVYTEGLVQTDMLNAHLLEPLLENQPTGEPPPSLADLGRRLISISDQQVMTASAEVRDEVYRGKAALLVDGCAGALILGAQGWEERPVQSPPTEAPLRGPRDGFIENIVSNVALVRRRLCSPSLQVKYFRVGARSKSRVGLLYLVDLARPQLVHELETRIAALRFDGILDTNQLRELLVGSGFSPFPRMESTERPDKVVAALLSGKVAIMVDNSPFASLAPCTLMDSVWAPDDYYTAPAIIFLLRLVRVAGWAATLFLSPLYIAVEMYNPELVRTDLALFLARERQGIPLTAAVEIYFLEMMSEMIHEATVRLPAKIGSAATVVGGLIIGEAAARAGLISNIVIIVVAISAIGSFTLPGQEFAQGWRATKWVLIAAASLFGVYGIFAGAFVLLSWLASRDSFGTPYLAPLAPFIPGDLKRDFVYRMPWSAVRRRPTTYGAIDPDRTPVPQSKKYRDSGER